MTPATLCRAACLVLFVALNAAATPAGNTAAETRIFVASGVPAGQVPGYLARVDRLAAKLDAGLPAGSIEAQAAAIHAFLHERILRGRYEPSASHLGVALDGGPFNCVSATVLYTLLARRCGVSAVAMSVPGHVWCRVAGLPALDIECTNRDWFAIRARYQGVPTSRVSTAMARHRGRVVVGRPLDEEQLRAVLHYNRGVSLIEAGRLSPAAWQNLQALALDPDCRPARENLAALGRENLRRFRSEDLISSLIFWSLEQATATPLALP